MKKLKEEMEAAEHEEKMLELTGGSKPTSRCPLLNARRGGSGLGSLPPPLHRPQLGRGRRGVRGGLLEPLPALVAALVVDNDSGILAMLDFLVMFLHALCSLRSSSGLRCSASRPVWTRRTMARSSSIRAVACAWLVFLVSRLALCSLWLSAGSRAGRYGPEAQFCTWLVLLVTMLLALCSRLLLSSPRCWASWPVQTMVFPQLQFLYEVFDVPGKQEQVPSTAAVHQQGRLPSFRGAEVDSHCLTVQADH